MIQLNQPSVILSQYVDSESFLDNKQIDFFQSNLQIDHEMDESLMIKEKLPFETSVSDIVSEKIMEALVHLGRAELSPRPNKKYPNRPSSLWPLQSKYVVNMCCKDNESFEPKQRTNPGMNKKPSTKTSEVDKGTLRAEYHKQFLNGWH